MFNGYGRMGTMPRRGFKPGRSLPSPFGAPVPQGPNMGIGDFMRDQIQQNQPTRGWAPNHRGVDGPMMPPAQPGGALAGYAPQRYTPGQAITDPSEAHFAEMLRGGPQMAQRAQMADQLAARNTAMANSPQGLHASELARGGPQMVGRARYADHIARRNQAMAARWGR